MDASNVPNQDVPKLSRDQWGATLGGPIKHDRAYFFGSFEQLGETRGVNINRAAIPSFIASGIATPSGTEDFGIAPETTGFTGLGKVDYVLQLGQPPERHRERQHQDVSGEISSPVGGHDRAAERGAARNPGTASRRLPVSPA